MTLDELESKINAPASLDLISILQQGNITDFYQSLLASNEFIVNVEQSVPTRDNGELISLHLTGTTSAFGFDNIPIEIVFEEQYRELKSSLALHLLENKLTFPNFSRFSIGDVGIELEVSDALVPVRGSVNGTVDILADIRFSMEYPVFQNDWLFKGTFQNPKGLIDLVEFTGGAELVESLPSFVTNALDFKVRDVGLLYNAQESKLVSFGLTAINEADIKVLPGLFLEEISLSGTIGSEAAEGSSPPVFYSISGQFLIGEGKDFPKDGGLFVTASTPDFQFSGGLSEDSRLSVTELIKYYFETAENFPEIDITKLAFSAHPSRETYKIRATIEDDWKFYLSENDESKYIALRQVSFSVGKSSLGVDGEIGALFNIAGIDILISASHREAASGWDFYGSSGQGQAVPIGELIEELAQNFGAIILPAAIADLTLENLEVSFNTKTKNFMFACEAKFPVDDKQADILIKIEVTNDNNGSYTKTFGGNITIGTLKFELHFIDNAVSDLFVAAYTHTGDKQGIDIKSLIEEVSTGIAEMMPVNLEIDLKDVLFAFIKTSTGSKFLFGMDVGTGINLSNLPLVGQEFPPDMTVGVDDLRLLVASSEFVQSDVSAVNNLLPPDITKLPVPLASTSSASSGGNGTAETVSGNQAAISKGLNVSAFMKFGVSTQPLALPVADSSTTNPTPVPTPAPTTTSSVVPSDNAKWFTLQKSFGPVSFERVGVEYRDKTVWFLLDAAMTFAGLTLSLDGLAAGSPLNEFSPRFDLKGLGIDYRNGDLSIGGAFLRKKVSQGSDANDSGGEYYEYDGAAVIKTPQLSLSAIGSYAKLDGHPSLFIYAVLDYPLGGPSFFFVTGLAAGFGYNRKLNMPPIEKVAQFSLVDEAINGTGSPNNIERELQKLQQDIPPSIGDIFFAVGIKFTSFKIIDSFVLLTLSFGQRFELNILGLSTLISPPQVSQSVSPLAVVQMAVRASFIPKEGFLGVLGQLTSASFILSRSCHLTGGFAFYCWFSGTHSGDFVQTIGGYHPNYNVPAHYPKVPRLGVNWQVDSNLSIKGSAYYALTSSALMAGGSLEAVWKSGSLKAYFNASANFIIAWKPYHYDADIKVKMGVSYTFEVDLLFGTVRKTISADVSANLHIWGPEFSGKAHIDIKVITFDVTFGAPTSSRPRAIAWSEFKSSFLPDDNKICTLAVKAGMVKTTDDNSWIINPKDFSLTMDCAIPLKGAYKRNPSKSGAERDTPVEITGTYQTGFGIGSMEVGSADLSSKFYITIHRDSVWAGDDFDYLPILKKVPAALWGQSLSPSLKGQAFIEQALSGFEIRAKGQPLPGVTSDIATDNLKYDTVTVENAYVWEDFNAFISSDDEDEARRKSIRSTVAAESIGIARQQLLDALGVSAPVTIGADIADAFLIPPAVGTFADNSTLE